MTGTIGKIVVCPLSSLEETIAQSGARSMISLNGPERQIAHPRQIEKDRWLNLVFNDIAKPRGGLIAPSPHHVSEIIEFGKKWDRSAALLIQCWMGISRSTAAALILACTVKPDLPPNAWAEKLRQASPMATPNPLMIAHGDALLGLDGALIAATHAIGRGRDAREGIVFELAISKPVLENNLL